jgi:hypothetical protein
MWLIHHTEAPLFFNVTCEIIDAFFPLRHEFKNSFAVDSGLLHLQPFTMSHFHFLIILEQAVHPTVVPKQVGCVNGCLSMVPNATALLLPQWHF